MTHPESLHHNNSSETILELFKSQGFDGLAQALSLLFNEAMKIERAEFLQASPFERNGGRVGYANGYKPKQIKSRVGNLSLQIPQVRDLPPGTPGFYPQSVERGLRSERALKLALAEMYIQGVSTRRVKEITEALCGFEVSASQVSRAAASLDEELEAWRNRRLGAYRYLILDARYEKVRHGGSVVSCAVLWAIGICKDGKRSVLGASVALSEADVHWRAFLESLQNRGLYGLEMITSDDHAGLRAAMKARFPGVKWQRCQFHIQQNAMAYVPRLSMRAAVAEDIRNIFNAANQREAARLLKRTIQKWQPKAPKLAKWMEENITESLTVFSLPSAHRRRLRTSNSAERVNLELRRRTRVASIFPNEASLLRLVSALLLEIDDEWQSGRIYLTMTTIGVADLQA